MANFYLIKYKDKDGSTQTIIDEESDMITSKHICRDMQKELQRQNGVEYPTFAVEKITKEQFDYLKRKGYFAL